MMFAFAIAMCILFGSLGRIVMKRALSRQSPLVCAFFFVLTQAIVALPAYPFLYETPSTLRYSLSSGVLFGISIYFYYASFHGGEVSLLTPLRGLRGVVALIISLLWWHEALSFGEMAGVVVIGLGVLLLQRGSRFTKFLHFLFHKEALLMITSVVFGVLASGFDKSGATELGIYPHYIWTSTTSFLTLGLILLLSNRRKTWHVISQNFHYEVLLVGLLFSGAFFFHLYALQIERVTIVNGLLPIGTLVTTFLAARYLKEAVRKKVLGTATMVLGTIILALS